jgi:putative transferase (TIGR04331 family)
MEKEIENPKYIFNFYLADDTIKLPENYFSINKYELLENEPELGSYIRNQYECVSSYISDEIARINNEKFDWDLYTADWLSFIIEKYLLRKKFTQNLLLKYNSIKYFTHYNEPDDKEIRPFDKSESFQLSNNSFAWNDNLQIYIMEKLGCEILKIEKNKCPYQSKILYRKEDNLADVNLRIKVIKYVKDKLNKLQKGEYLLIDLYFSNISLFKLFLMKKTVPFMTTFYEKEFKMIKQKLITNQKKFDRHNVRKNKLRDESQEIFNFVLKEMPIIYSIKLKNLVEDIPFMQRTKYFLTSNATLANDLVNFYAIYARKKYDTKLVLFQHGGTYFTNKYHRSRDNEIALSDIFFSWGNIANTNKVREIGMTKRKFKNKRKGKKILICGPTFSKCDDQLNQIDGNNFWIYNQLQRDLISNLKPEIVDTLTYRKLNINWARNKDFLTENLQHRQIDKNQKIHKSINEHNLILTLVDSTIFLECIGSDIPVIGVWPNFDKYLTVESKKLYELAINNGMIHNSGLDAALWINSEIDDIQTWWSSEELLKIRTEFKVKFCSKFKLSEIIKTLDE